MIAIVAKFTNVKKDGLFCVLNTDNRTITLFTRKELENLATKGIVINGVRFKKDNSGVRIYLTKVDSILQTPSLLILKEPYKIIGNLRNLINFGYLSSRTTLFYEIRFATNNLANLNLNMIYDKLKQYDNLSLYCTHFYLGGITFGVEDYNYRSINPDMNKICSVQYDLDDIGYIIDEPIVSLSNTFPPMISKQLDCLDLHSLKVPTIMDMSYMFERVNASKIIFFGLNLNFVLNMNRPFGFACTASVIDFSYCYNDIIENEHKDLNLFNLGLDENKSVLIIIPRNAKIFKKKLLRDNSKLVYKGIASGIQAEQYLAKGILMGKCERILIENE